jgi:hypothetical protein
MARERLPRIATEAQLFESPTSSDHLVFPLVAGVLTHLLLPPPVPSKKWDPANDRIIEELRQLASELEFDCAASNDAAWERDSAPYARIQRVAIHGWIVVPFRAPEMRVPWKQHTGDDGDDPTLYEAAAISWLRSNATRPLVDLALAGILGIHGVTREDDPVPLVAQRARGIRVDIADILRQRNLLSWPRIVRTVSDGWVNGGAARFGLQLANGQPKKR